MPLPPHLHLIIEDRPASADMDALSDALEAFNESRWPQHQGWAPMGVFVRDQAKMAAGLVGETYAGWLFVRYLWVSDALRGRGVGRQLLAAAEGRALERGCHAAWLDTFSFQAPGFYRKLGYEVFAELAWSADHQRIFLRKSLG